MKKRTTAIALFLLFLFAGNAQHTITDTLYYPLDTIRDPYTLERCRLGIHVPPDSEGKPTVIFIHGGGMTGGEKYFPPEIPNNGLITVATTYRFSPRVKCPIYIDDAAAAVAWVYKNIEKMGGDKRKIYVAGQSAGGFLAAMIALNKSYLAKFGVDADSLAGYISISGQMTTHFAILNEQGIPANSDTEIADEYSPIYHVRKMDIPFLCIIGDRMLDMPGRFKQNKKMVEMLSEKKAITALWEFKTKSHNTLTSPALAEVCQMIANDSLQYISDKTLFDSEISLRNIYDSKQIESVSIYNMQGKPIEKENAYSRMREVLVWKSVDTLKRTNTRKILRL